MTVRISDAGFESVSETEIYLSLDELRQSETGGHALDVSNDVDIEELRGFLDQISLIRVPFPSFADGRGYSVARRLRLLGYQGTLRAAGHVLADQYPNARRSGFDDVEISDELAQRQPENQWLAFADWDGTDYQTRLRKAS